MKTVHMCSQPEPAREPAIISQSGGATQAGRHPITLLVEPCEGRILEVSREKERSAVAHSMTESSVVPIDVGAGAREQALPPEAAGRPKEQPTQSPPEPPKAMDNAVDDPRANKRDALADHNFKNDLADKRRGNTEKAAWLKTASN